jgi:Flp pilus assembly protein TadD
MESYQRAWFLDPVGQVQSLRAMAAIEEREFNTKDALKYLERARPLAKEDPTFHEAVARVQARLKHFDAAAEAMRLACELAPGVALYHNLRAVYLKEEGHKEAALEEYRKALELEQDAGVRRDLELEILRLTR